MIISGHGIRSVVLAAVVLSQLGGCAASWQNGAIIGAGIGAAGGAGVGVLLADEDLAGSPSSGPGGDTALPKTETILASMAIGTVVGTIVGIMAGGQREQKYVRRKALPPPPDGGESTAKIDPIIGKF